MTIAYFCIVVSVFIPLVCVGYAKCSKKGYDNRVPKEFIAGLEGKAKRAYHAQNNFYETFPAFGIGVVAAHQMGGVQTTIDALAVTYVAARIAYAIFYIQDKPALRTLVWFLGFSATIGLFFVGG